MIPSWLNLKWLTFKLFKETHFTVADYDHTKIWCILAIMLQHNGSEDQLRLRVSDMWLGILQNRWRFSLRSHRISKRLLENNMFFLIFVVIYLTMFYITPTSHERHYFLNHGNSTICSITCSAQNKENIEAPHYWPFDGINRWAMYYPHTGTIIQKAAICLDFIEKGVSTHRSRSQVNHFSFGWGIYLQHWL